MAQRKKKQDKLIAGVLALLTAFSPVASVVPVYAADLDDTGSSSITMDPDSMTIDEVGSDGIVLDESSEGSDGITVIDDDSDSVGGITIDGDVDSDGIDIGDTVSDGIDIDDSDDGIDIQESDDGITINGIGVGDTVDGITIDSITRSEDGIIIESTDENGNQDITIDPWGGEDLTNLSSGKVPVPVPVIHELSIDIRSIHGMVELTPVSGVEESQSKYIRIVESDDGYDVIVTDVDGNVTYEAFYDDSVDVAWSEFLSIDSVYAVTAIADDGYVLTDYSIVSSVDQDEVIDVNDFESGIYESYSWDISLRDNKDVVVNFGSADGIEIVDTGDMSYDLADT